jgi:hypothetical protein
MTVHGLKAVAAAFLLSLLVWQWQATDLMAQSATVGGPPPRAASPAGTKDAAGGEAWNTRLVAHHDLDGRAAYQPTIHRYGSRYILFVGHHEGVHVNHLNGKSETNGTSVLDVTDPARPKYLVHIPASGKSEEVQHAQVCDGKDLKAADPSKVYLLRTNGQESHEMWDVTSPESPRFIVDVSVTGTSAGPRPSRQTHKNQWDCRTGYGFLISSVDGWRSPRVMQIYDLNNPAKPVHIRDWNLHENAPGVTVPEQRPGGNGLHQPMLVGDRLFAPYGMNNGGVVQILDAAKLITGDPAVADRFAPTRRNLEYPQIARINMPTFYGGHTAKPVYGMKIPGLENFKENGTRDVMVVVSEETDEMCLGTNQAIFFMDITQIDKPFGMSTWFVPEEPGDYCNKGGRFGPHSAQDSFNPAFHGKLLTVAYFNAGLRVVDMRDPFHPREVGFYIPAPTAKTQEICAEVDGKNICKRAIQTNNNDIDDRGLIYALDRSGTGLHIIELTGEASRIAGGSTSN